MSPATAKCRRSGCSHLKGVTVETAKGSRAKWYCDITEKIPGNMAECPLDDPMRTMKVLAVRQPWATLIAEGKKTLDIRSRNCHYRGPVAIYASRGNIRRKDRKYFKGILGRDADDLPHGYIVATAEITGTIRFDTPDEFAEYTKEHYCTPFFFQPGCYGWQLSNIQPLANPIGFKMPKGCVNWSAIRNSVVQNFQSMAAVEGVTA